MFGVATKIPGDQKYIKWRRSRLNRCKPTKPCQFQCFSLFPGNVDAKQLKGGFEGDQHLFDKDLANDGHSGLSIVKCGITGPRRLTRFSI